MHMSYGDCVIVLVIRTVSVVLFMCIPYRYEPQFFEEPGFKPQLKKHLGLYLLHTAALGLV